jgi:poly(3-hydroxybutyrate) depolymerase
MHKRCKKFLDPRRSVTELRWSQPRQAKRPKVIAVVKSDAKRSSSLLFLLCVLVAPVAAPASRAAAEELPRLGVSLPETSVSGLSSGAYMAGQIELAHAKDIVGAGIVAGGPFGCAVSASSRLFPYWPMVVWQNAMLADHECMQVDWGAPDANELVTQAKDLAAAAKIDPLGDLADDKVYLFSGNADATVRRQVVEAAKRFYEVAGVPAASVMLVERDGGHAFLTETEGASCDVTKTPFIDDCDYDQAKAILEWIYGPLAPPSPSPTGRFVSFDQTAFDKEPPNGLAKEGVVYVPSACANGGGCRLHIVFHGCDQSQEDVGDDFIKKSGFARYADTNRLVVLFPQIAGSLANPHGCWDWWGYSDMDFLEKEAPQIAAIWAMAERLASQP